MKESLNEQTTRLRNLIREGVIIDDERTTYIAEDAVIGRGVRIEPNVTIGEGTVIGANTRIQANTVINRSEIGEECVIRFSLIEDSRIGNGVTVGPFAYLRNNAVIEDSCRIGDFVEIKNSTLHRGVKAAHLSYIGDAEVGEKTNVGCGTVFANYNGMIKQRTTVGANTFIGCNTNLVAPLSIGCRVYIAAGSTVTEDIPDGALCIARERQVNKIKWKDIRR